MLLVIATSLAKSSPVVVNTFDLNGVGELNIIFKVHVKTVNGRGVNNPSLTSIANHLTVICPISMGKVTLIVCLQQNHLRHLRLITSGTRQRPYTVPQVGKVALIVCLQHARGPMVPQVADIGEICSI